MAQQSRVLTVLSEDLGSVPSTYMEAHNHLLTPVLGGSDAVFWSLRAQGTHAVHRYIGRQSSHTHKITVVCLKLLNEKTEEVFWEKY